MSATPSESVKRHLGAIHHCLVRRGYRLIAGPKRRRDLDAWDGAQGRIYQHGWTRDDMHSAPTVTVEWSLPHPDSTPLTGVVRCHGSFRWVVGGPIHLMHYALDLPGAGGLRALDEFEALYHLARTVSMESLIEKWESAKAFAALGGETPPP